MDDLIAKIKKLLEADDPRITADEFFIRHKKCLRLLNMYSQKLIAAKSLTK